MKWLEPDPTPLPAMPPGLRRASVARAVAALRELYDPQEIWLFGSAAKDMARPQSDIDVLVVMESDATRHARGHEFREAFLDEVPRFDVIYFTAAELKHQLANPNSFASSVMKAAIRVYPPPRRRPQEVRTGPS